MTREELKSYVFSVHGTKEQLHEVEMLLLRNSDNVCSECIIDVINNRYRSNYTFIIKYSFENTDTLVYGWYNHEGSDKARIKPIEEVLETLRNIKG